MQYDEQAVSIHYIAISYELKELRDLSFKVYTLTGCGFFFILIFVLMY